ncbi:phosphoserine phosphatase SerB [Herbaspirillum autotrophicum]|uniref:phosphoserine phosphatase SerB n=1 Tax=Herbaspirillum autotrophicum TaxID=180195 RepID=UPI00067D8F00|nr:phosphoserine phosphatase SerB [Herbaspirillum autotrophicum]
MQLLIQSESPVTPQAVAQLSAVLQATPSSGTGDPCLTFSLAAAPAPETRAAVRDICHQHQCDHGWISKRRVLASYGLLVFDMDSTLINIECIDELADCVGRKAEVAAITERAMRGEEMDYDQSMIARVQLLRGLAARDLKRVYDERLTITPGARQLVQQARRAGLKTAIISGGFDYFADRLRAELEIDVAISNRLSMEHGYVTGGMDNPPVNAQVKASTVKSLCAEWGVALSDTIVAGDGANDLQMMAIAGVSVGYRPKQIVAEKVDIQIAHLALDSVLGYLTPNGFAARV